MPASIFIQISTIRCVFTNQKVIKGFFNLLISFLIMLPVIGQNTYQMSWSRDLPLGISGGGMLGTSFILKAKKEALTPEQLGALNREDINCFDRGATYNWSEPTAHASDAVMFLSVAMPSLIFIDEKARQEYKSVLLMTSETYLLTAGLTGLVKELARRERPYTYNENVPLEEKQKKDARSSFFSGHTSMTASSAFLTAKLYADFNPHSRFRPLVWTGAALLPALVGVLRFHAGKHFWTDIIAGYAIGAAVGVSVPAIHKIRTKN